MKKADTKALSVLTAVLSSASLTAIAQPADNRSATIEEVIVTAQKVEESLQDTPVSVSAFGAEDLQQIGVSEAKDVANFTPGLTMRKQSASQDNYAIGIRSVASGETALAIDPTVGIYQDGVYIARSTGAAFDIVDLKRIEVLRGPQGTLFGRNTIGGAINVVTEKPKGEFAFRQAVTYAARDSRSYHTTVDTPAWGNVAAKFSMRTAKHDGQNESIYTGEQLGNGESQAYRLAVNWVPSETVMVDYVYDKSDRQSNTATTQLVHVRPTYASPSSPTYGGQYYVDAAAGASADRLSKLYMTSSDVDETASDIDGHAVTVSWDWAENSTVKSISSYRDWTSLSRATEFGSFPVTFGTVYDLSGTYGPVFTPVPGGTLLPIFAAQRNSFQKQLTQEFQVVGTMFSEFLNYNVGLYYFEEQADEDNPQSFILPTCLAASAVCTPGNPGFNATLIGTASLIGRPDFAYSTDNKSLALYGQFTLNVAPDLDLTFGYRWTKDDKETTLTNGFGNPSTVQTFVDDNDWTKFTPSFTADYRFSDEISTYFRIATGYRSGGYNVRASTEADFRTPFDEENILSYELGVKSDLFDRKLRLNAAVYHTEYEDRQVAQFSAGSGGASTNIVNAGENVVDGFEIEAVYLPFIGARVITTYSYIDVDHKEFITTKVNPVTGFPVGNSNVDIAGNGALDNTYAPQHQASLALEYTFAPKEWGQLTLRVDTTFTDEISFHPQLNLYDESNEHQLVNARATITEIPAFMDGTLTVAAWGKNLENKEYRDFGIDFGQLGFAVSNWGELRSWGLDFIYQFNR
ncbi:iron complex outermembrane receptor protein [Litorivivens lipolytica]|uniref:Iron complex outermembrane receptor protein n=1 Tax=Litorivivens lipolytica TaxID=1524264 RepID=A0A7W4Z564_9GAMM|nr:TonB-dependent receptor [Litorivivens lipolytica]MBB3047164.1 iron complex outermembrane receptor protein [Litorivivens lipolytica]